MASMANLRSAAGMVELRKTTGICEGPRKSQLVPVSEERIAQTHIFLN